MDYSDPAQDWIHRVEVHEIKLLKAEIERLQAKTKADAEAWHEQEEKIERLRAALARIVVDGTDDAKTRNDCAEIARLALVGPSTKYQCETCRDDPIECAKTPLRHCEKLERDGNGPTGSD